MSDTDLQCAGRRLAELIPNGNLLALTDMSAFLDAVADEIELLQGIVDRLPKAVGWGPDGSEQTVGREKARQSCNTEAST